MLKMHLSPRGKHVSVNFALPKGFITVITKFTSSHPLIYGRPCTKNFLGQFFPSNPWNYVINAYTFQSTIVSSGRTVIGKTEFFLETLIIDSALSLFFDIRRSTINVENSTIVCHGRVKPFDNFRYVDLQIKEKNFRIISKCWRAFHGFGQVKHG